MSIKQHIRLFSWGLLSLIIVSCSEDAKDEFPLDHLVGQWVSEAEGSQFIESWTKEADGSLAGVGFEQVHDDSINIEKLELYTEDDQLIYSAMIANQNDGMAVPFYCVEQSEEEIIFENADHDFPQRIVYSMKDEQSLEVLIENLQGTQTIPFNFRKSAQ